MRYENAGDQYIRRIWAMLAFDSPKFSVLMLHFDRIDDAVTSAVNECFPILELIRSFFVSRSTALGSGFSR